jgi:hypothetical protein
VQQRTLIIGQLVFDRRSRCIRPAAVTISPEGAANQMQVSADRWSAAWHVALSICRFMTLLRHRLSRRELFAYAVNGYLSTIQIPGILTGNKIPWDAIYI